MNKYEYKGQLYTVNELSDMSGIAAPTIRDRLRRGYSIDQAIVDSPTHESVRAFCESSWWEDWLGMTTTYLYEIYWKWSIDNQYRPIQQAGFTRQLFKLYPNLKSVPTNKPYLCGRVIRRK